MPRLHSDVETGSLYILHSISDRNEDDAGVRRFGVSDEAAEHLAFEGYQGESWIPHRLFHQLLEQELLWPGQEPRYKRADRAFQIALTKAVNDYFTDLATSAKSTERLIELFRIDILSQAIRIQKTTLRREMLLYIGAKLRDILSADQSAEQGVPLQLAQLLLNRTPAHWRGAVAASIGREFLFEEPQEKTAAVALAAEHIEETQGGTELRGFDRLPQEHQEWVVNTCTRYPGVLVQESTDAKTGEIHFVFNGLPAELPQKLVDIALSTRRQAA